VSRSVPANRLVYGLVCLFLASLSIKALQELGGIRVLSVCIPFLLLALLPGLRVRIPAPLRNYVLFTCLLLPAISIGVKRGTDIYEAYFAVTVLASLAVLTVCVYGLKIELARMMRAYADIMVFMCMASVFTLQEQWFGGYSVRGFSDFATFFALQISVGVPFLAGRFVNVKRTICLVALFFTFSRLSLVLGLAVVLVQLYQENRKSFYRLAPLLVGGVVLVATSTSIGSLMAEKFANVFSAALGGSESVEINPSDLGRLAYATVTVESLDHAGVVIAGHGIKTNRDIVNSRLDTSIWGLDEDLADATVHNVYLEILSDSGAIGLIGFVAFLGFAGRRIVSRFGLLSPPGLAISVFAISYLFEANYVSFFFQFFMCYFLWIASDASRSPSAASRRGARPDRHLPQES
jgi:hypothetical protein